MTTTGQDISVYFRTELEDAGDIELVVVLPTFRRPDHVVKTLKTIVSQRPDISYATVVVENDADGLAGAAAAKDFFLGHPSDSVVIVAHQRGNCHAYNAGWATALQTYPNLKAIAIIDDDEVAAPEWLDCLIAAQETTGADMVGGPQLPVFEGDGGQKWKRHPVFMPHYDATGPVPILYSSGNVLVTRGVLDAMPQPFLDPAFNFIGGGDADFYSRCKAKGFSFAWAADAWVAETVPARRTSASWIRARSLRNGAISTMLEHRRDPSFRGRLRTFGKSLALLGASIPRGLELWNKSGLAAAGSYHFYVAIGRLMAELGLVNEQYRTPEKN
ncbi:glycosyltransferase [Ensifer sp. PDNC004]|uniref:glycosyltransferase family 2 protein n=1 Tax=Ensifer sp. PDNC004 TaxID=2811423 RepID=UPI001966025C|nr:glycosyltransferase [Ensifer sp. PDNC004]QRY66468.1 glycosyltransferase [Ensifer sp. PDNC004]